MLSRGQPAVTLPVTARSKPALRLAHRTDANVVAQINRQRASLQIRAVILYNREAKHGREVVSSMRSISCSHINRPCLQDKNTKHAYILSRRLVSHLKHRTKLTRIQSTSASQVATQTVTRFSRNDGESVRKSLETLTQVSVPYVHAVFHPCTCDLVAHVHHMPVCTA